jgi:chemotaxis protein histidine kinase CheA/ActR/RegA family two-component response regulator
MSMEGTPVARLALADKFETLAGDLDDALQHAPQAEAHAALQLALAALAAQAREAGLRGLPELLRLLQSGLEEKIHAGSPIADDERRSLVLWFLHLAAYCAGTLPPAECTALLDGLRAVPWIPAPAPRICELIVGRLLPTAGAAAEFHPQEPSAPPPDAVQDEDAAAPIWVGREELGLAAAAIASQLLPLTQQLTECEEPAQHAALLEELDFQSGLIAGALEVLGLQCLGQLTQRVQDLLRSGAAGPARIAPAALIDWQVALLAFLQRPDSDSMLSLCEVSHELLGGFERAPLMAEYARIRLGIDPESVAQRKVVATAADIDLSIAADVLPGVLDGMLRELPGNAASFGEGLRDFLAHRSDAGLAHARRFAHTLKGDANTVGLRGLANLAHALEDVLVELARRADAPGPELAETLLEAADTVEMIADHVLGRAPAPEALLDVYGRVLAAGNAFLAAGAQADPMPLPAAVTWPDPGSPPLDAPAPAEPAAARLPAASHGVEIALLDELLRLAGESIVATRQIERRIQDIGIAYRELVGQNQVDRDLVAQLDDLVALRGAALQSARLDDARDVDPLELDQYTELHVVSRRMIESNSDRVAFMQRMDADLLMLDDLISMQERTQVDLQRLVLKTRTVPLSSASGRLQRVVRQAARQLQKQVELEIEGSQLEIDSELLERIVKPLSHILRNAVDHGIESAPARVGAGKPECGRIRLELATSNDTVEIIVADDGRGLDLEAIHRKAAARGLLAADARASDEELAQLILLPGFSTKDEAGHVSGRGIGMDVVAQSVGELRGSIALRSVTGQGLTIRIRLPASLASANVVLASDAGEFVAAVASSIHSIVALAPGDFRLDAEGRPQVEVGGQALPALPLRALFEPDRVWSMPAGNRIGLLVESIGMGQRVIHAERVDQVRNVVVKNVGGLAAIPAFRGITILGDGGIAPVLDLAQSLQALAGAAGGHRIAPDAEADLVPRIVIADDSLSVRRALSQLMQDAGYRAVAARDGVEALDAIRDLRPAAVLLDLEMPRLNGLDVTRFLRTQAATAELPVVMITSRATDKYRRMAEEAGVDRLLGKPFDEDELVLTVNRLIGAAQAPGSLRYPARR